MSEQELTQKSASNASDYESYQSQENSSADQIIADIPSGMLEKYTFVSKLGEGSQGNVFKAIRKSDGLTVAIKKIRIDSVSTWKEYDLFHREADVLASIHEPCVAEFYEAREFLNEKKPSAFIVQELLQGRSLQKMLKTGYRFTISRIFKMALGLVGLLERLHAHEPPIIHRDIKPNNIIMRPLQNTDDFEPCLIDFGAVANPTVQKGGSTVAGTYGYMPPEQLVGRPCPASDIYSLGATIVYMLTGVEPADMRVADFRLIIDPYLENVPRPIVNVLHQMLDPKPETRLADYKKLKSIFTRFSNDDYNIDTTESALDASLINQQLMKVNAFNQAGNLDLWMQLPEKTPRCAPAVFSSVILTYEKTCRIRNISKTARKQYRRMAIIGGISLFILALTINNYISSLHKWYADTDAKMLLILVSIAVAIVLLFSIIIILSNRRNISTLKKQIAQSLTLFDKSTQEQSIKILCGYEQMDNAPILTLLKFGRKAIAIIIDFQDLPIQSRYRELNFNQITAKTRVPFKLRYRFNPPDDASADDLIHEITIYNHQTEGLEPGTPIPILYYIDPEDNSNVISMPYPFPFEEIRHTQETNLDIDNLYGQTKGVY